MKPNTKRIRCAIETCERPMKARARGKTPLCGMHYQRWSKHGDPQYQRLTHNVCTASGCGKPHHCRGYCKMHYTRLSRTGQLELRKPDSFKEHSGGYLLRYDPDHPLANAGGGRVYEHRRVYYNANGEGPFKCHWCGIVVTWSDMHVDHLNDDPKDNLLENLVASCPICNQKRGHHKVAKTMRQRGVKITFDGRTMCLSEWAVEVGISVAALRYRIDAGWPIEQTLSRPRGKSGPKSARGRSRSRQG